MPAEGGFRDATRRTDAAVRIRQLRLAVGLGRITAGRAKQRVFQRSALERELPQSHQRRRPDCAGAAADVEELLPAAERASSRGARIGSDLRVRYGTTRGRSGDDGERGPHGDSGEPGGEHGGHPEEGVAAADDGSDEGAGNEGRAVRTFDEHADDVVHGRRQFGDAAALPDAGTAAGGRLPLQHSAVSAERARHPRSAGVPATSHDHPDPP